jgi:hypothetical protein
MADELHGRGAGDTSALETTDRGAAEIVRDLADQLGLLAGRPPRLPDADHALTFAVKYPSADPASALLDGVGARPDGEESPSLVEVAAVVYRIALKVYLERRHSIDWNNIRADDPLLIASVMNEQSYGDALLNAYGLAGLDDSPIEA